MYNRRRLGRLLFKPASHVNGSELLLEKVLWFVGRLIVYMDICTLHIWQRFKLDLELFSNVMCRHQTFSRVHYNVNLNQQSGTRCVRADGVNGRDERRMGHSCRAVSVIPHIWSVGGRWERQKTEAYKYR